MGSSYTFNMFNDEPFKIDKQLNTPLVFNERVRNISWVSATHRIYGKAKKNRKLRDQERREDS